MAVQEVITSRRKFLAGAGLAGAAAILPIAAVAAQKPDQVSSELIRAIERLEAASASMFDADIALYHAQQKVSEWDVANPQPSIPDDYEIKPGETVTTAFARAESVNNAAVTEWMKRRTSVLRANRIAPLHREAAASAKKFETAVKAVASIDARNLDEIILKAQASTDHDDRLFHIAHSVIDDLLEIKQAQA